MSLNPFKRRTPFVNEGPDPRIEGPIGELLARFQRGMLFYSTAPPKRIFWRGGSWGHAGLYDPFFVSVFLRRDDFGEGGKPLFWSFRIGYRHDPFIGDGNNPKEPTHNPPGGYFPDIIIKPRIDNEVSE